MNKTYQIKNDILVGYPEKSHAIKIPEGVRAIESYLFDDAFISYLSMPESVKTLGVQTFCWCDRLCIIDFSKHIKRLERDVFNSIAACRLHPPKELIYIGNSAFAGSLSLLFFQFPENVILISDRAFNHCVSMRYITFGNQVRHIGDAAFRRTALEFLYLPNSLLSIGRYAFADCENLRHVALREGLLSIGEGAFRGCVFLKNITIPDSVVSISKNAFADCDMLEAVELPNQLINTCLKGVFPLHTKLVFREKADLLESLQEADVTPYVKSCNDLSIAYDTDQAKAYMEQADVQMIAEAHFRLYSLDKSQNNRIHLLRAASLGCEEAVHKLIERIDK